jgi:hypothetical protein
MNKASCGLFQTQHEAVLHDIPADAYSRKPYYGDSIFCVSFTRETGHYFQNTTSPKNGESLNLHDCGEQSIQNFLTFMQ